MAERLRLALDLAAVGIWDEDLETGEVYENSHSRAALGFTEDRPHSLEQHLSSIHPEDIGRLRLAIAQAHDPNGSGQYDLDVRAFGADNGTLRHLHKKAW
jgi:PAS domain-containing protein